MYLGFFDRAQGIFVDEGLQGLEVSILKERGMRERKRELAFSAHGKRKNRIKPDIGVERSQKRKASGAYPSSILEDGQYQALLMSKRYQCIGFFRRPGEWFLNNN